MKILYAASTSGHLISFHIPYINALADMGHEVHTAARGPAPECGGAAKHFDIPLKKMMISPSNFLAAARFSSVLRREKYDLIVLNTSLAAFFLRLSLRLSGKNGKVVNIVHGYLFDRGGGIKNSLLLEAEKLTAGVTDDIVTMNAEDHAIAVENRLCRGSVRESLGMGIKEGFHVPSAEERLGFRHKLGLEDDSFVLVYAAEFSTRKNQSFLIKSLALLPENTVLLLPGRGELIEQCRQLAEKLELDGRVIFPGFVDDIESYYCAADACVSPSRSEGLPFNIMEAMACGLPVAARMVKGHTDLVTEGENGLLYTYDDEKGFCDAVRTLIADAELREKMSRAARTVSEKYTLKNAMPVMLEAMLACTGSTDKGKTYETGVIK